MSTVMSPDSVAEALEMVRAGLGYLAAADVAQLPAETQAECLRQLERTDAIATAARPGSWPRSPRARGTRGTRITASGPG